MGFILFIIASILYVPLTILNILVVCSKYVKTKGFFNVINGYFKQTAIDIDKFGNHQFRTMLNAFLLVENGYEFGEPSETISSVLGKNKLTDTLSKTGKVIVKILDTLDDNHCVKSIKK